MCRLFGMSGGLNEVQATFWLLDAPDSLLVQSASQPDGVGLGTFRPDGTPFQYRKPVELTRSQTFIADAQDVRSRTFVAHIRHATLAPHTIPNTHPFLQHGRLMAHNGVLGDLDELRARLGDYASLLEGETDSELYFTMITKHIDECGGDVRAGIVSAAHEIAANIEMYSLNMVLVTPTDLWALRYPETNELWILEHSLGGGGLGPGDEFEARSSTMRVHSGVLAIVPATVIASEPMDHSAGWRLLEPGELIHVDGGRRVTSEVVLSEPPAKMMVLAGQAAAAQGEA